VTYPFIDGIETDNKSQPQPVSLKGTVEVVAPGKVLTFDLSKKTSATHAPRAISPSTC